jgi:hypothetical protein
MSIYTTTHGLPVTEQLNTTSHGLPVTEQLNSDDTIPCTKHFGFGSSFIVKTEVISIDTITVFYNDDYVHNIWFYYTDNYSYVLNGPTDLTNITATNLSLINSSIVGIYIENDNNKIKCFQFNIFNLITKKTKWSPLFGKKEKKKKNYFQTYLYDYIPNGIKKFSTYVTTRLLTSDLNYNPTLIGFEIEYDSTDNECLLDVISTTSIPFLTTMLITTTTKILSTFTSSTTSAIHETKSIPVEVFIFSIAIPLVFILLAIIVIFFYSR